MGVLNKLTIKNLRLNKKRTVVTIIGIILSVALITAVASMYASGIVSLIKFETEEKGNFHYAFYDVPADQINQFKNNRKIENVCYTKHIGYAKLENSKNEYKPYAHLMGFTNDSLENLSIKLVEGRLPQNNSEILIPTHLKTNGRITLNVGDSITLDVGNRVSEGEELTQNNPFDEEVKEEIINTTRKTYKIVGIIERPASNVETYTAPGYTFITTIDNNNISGNVDLYTRYTKEGIKEQYKVTANILGVNEKIFEKGNKNPDLSEKELEEYNKEMEKAKYKVNINFYLITLETDPIGESSIGELGIVVGIVCGIIVFTSIFCIKNSFDISITEKTKQYGMLRSIGATKKQIRRNVFYEAFILGIIGIPMGVFIGLLVSYILVIVSNYFLKEMIVEGLKLQFAFSWIAVVVAIILGIITIYLSAIGSSRRASKISPITAIRNSGNIKIKAKKLKTPKIIDKLFGIGGEISYKNLKRNKKKYRTTVISIVVSVATFISLYTFMSLAFISAEEDIKMQEYNLSLTVRAENNGNIFNKAIETTKFDNIEKYSILKTDEIAIKNPKYSDEFIKNFTSEEKDEDRKTRIFAVGEEAYNNYLKELGLNYDDIKNKAILIDTMRIGEYSQETKKTTYKNFREFSYNNGSKITGEAYNKKDNVELEIGYVTDKKPFGLSMYENPIMIVSDELFDQHFDNNGILSIYYKTTDAEKLQNDIEAVIEENTGDYGYSINNTDENYRMLENLFILVAIFLYGFIIVISIIGMTNIFNTITTNMELRKQEFASLKSIGMTTKEFNRMIRLESIFMGAKSLLFGVPIGLGLSYLIYHYLAEESGMAYPVPLLAIAISVFVVFLLIACIMKYSMSKINKQNTIETIRNENI